MNLDIFRREFANGTISGSDVFTAIWLQDGPLSLSELAETLRVSTRTVQRSLGRLARAGLVEKRTHNKRQPCRDKWELTSTTRMALDLTDMPPGVPVAGVGIGGAKNAALLAVRVLAAYDPCLKAKLAAFREKMSLDVRDKAALIQEKGLPVWHRTR